MGTPNLTVPATVALGTATIGTTASKLVSLTNAGTDTLTVSAAQLSGASAFTVAEDPCAGKTVPTGATCAMRIAFTPTEPGAITATLTLTGDDGAPHAVTLHGTGAHPEAPTAKPSADAPAPKASTPDTTPPPAVARTPSVRPPSPPAQGATLTTTTATVHGRTLTLPLTCPATTACAITGTLTTSKIRRTIRLPALRLPAGTRRAVTLKLPATLLTTAHRRHITRLKATLTVRTAATTTRTTLTLRLHR
jgi:ASPM-SPD-2-Hydin domain-containing protein